MSRTQLSIFAFVVFVLFRSGLCVANQSYITFKAIGCPQNTKYLCAEIYQNGTKNVQETLPISYMGREMEDRLLNLRDRSRETFIFSAVGTYEYRQFGVNKYSKVKHLKIVELLN